jgi:hypothetical protein
MGVDEWFFFYWIALGAGGVSPGDVESSAAVIPNFADSGLAFGDGTAMSAGEAAHAVVVQLFVESGIGFADLLVEDGAEGGHFFSSLILALAESVGLPASGFGLPASGFRLSASGSRLRLVFEFCLLSDLSRDPW